MARLVVRWLIGTGLVGCGVPIPCPGDLSKIDGGCACPGAVRRHEPLTLPGGERDFCVDSTVTQGDGGQPGSMSPQSPGVTEIADPAVNEGGVGIAPVSPPLASLDAGPRVTPSNAPSDPAGGPAAPANCMQEERLCDAKDDDCDGRADEGAVCGAMPVSKPEDPSLPCVPTTWYRDCDADGFAAGIGGTVSACAAPVALLGCSAWTLTEPVAGKRDCNDATPVYAPNADFGVAGDGDGDRNCDGMIEMRVRRVRSPPVVEHMPTDTTDFCRYGLTSNLSCRCFSWDSMKWTSGPPCARSPAEAFISEYMDWWRPDPRVGSICEAAVTFATGSVDLYEVLATCR